MKTGNVTGNVYKRSVHRKIGTNGIGVKGAEYGEGCAFLTSENVDKAPEKAKQMWITAQSLSVWSGSEGAKLCVYEAVNRAAAAAVGRGEAKVLHGVHAADASDRLSRAGAAEDDCRSAGSSAEAAGYARGCESACVRCSHCACCDSRGACRSVDCACRRWRCRRAPVSRL